MYMGWCTNPKCAVIKNIIFPEAGSLRKNSIW